MAEEQAQAPKIKLSTAGQRSSPPKVGQVFDGKFEILSIVGAGGMSVVYKARHLLLDKIVALKVLQSDRLESQHHIDRFKREAQAASTLGHPNIVSVREYGIDENSHPYIVMDFVDGTSLAQTIKAQSISVPRALRIAAKICDGLQHAHERGVIHRDIKPENILLARDPEGDDLPMIADFGIARITLDDEERTRLTQTGEVFGTPAYMSPEQALGLAADCRTDIYSLGCVIYEMLSGKPPFTADNPLALLMKHTSTPAAALNDVPAEIQIIVARAMDKDPLARYESAASLRADLEKISNHSKIANVPELSYAKTLLLRALAWIIDLAVVSIPGWIIACSLLGGLSTHANRALSFCGLCEQSMPSFGITNIINNDGSTLLIMLALAISIATYLYHAILESSKWQATIGKRVVGLIVTSNSFGRLSFREASYRHWSKLIYFGMYALIVGLAPKLLSLREWAPIAAVTMAIITASAIVLRKRYQLVHDAISSAKVVPSRYGNVQLAGVPATPCTKQMFFSSGMGLLGRVFIAVCCMALVAWAVQVNLKQLSLSQAQETVDRLAEDAFHCTTVAEATSVFNQTRDLRSHFPVKSIPIVAALAAAADRLVGYSKFDEAEKLYNMSARLMDEDSNIQSMMAAATDASNAGLQQRNEHDYVGAERAGLRALALLSVVSEQSKRPADFDDQMYNALARLGWSYSDQKLWPKAIALFSRTLELDTVRKDDTRKSLVLLDIGCAQAFSGQTAQAIETYQHAAELTAKSGDHYWQGIALALLANCHNGQGDMAKARELCLQAQKLMQQKPICNYSWYRSYYEPFAISILKDNKVAVSLDSQN